MSKTLLLLVLLALTTARASKAPELLSELITVSEVFSLKAAPPRSAGQGPKGKGTSGSFRIETPVPTSSAILFWGDWELVDADNGDAVLKQADSVFFHHIMMYDGGAFVGGSSDERSTFGPQFHNESKYAWMTGESTKPQGSMYLVNFLPRAVNFKVRYTVRYYNQSDMPADMQPVVCKAFFDIVSLPSIPKQYEPAARFKQPMKIALTKRFRLVTGQAHGHIGGDKVSVEVDNKPVCDSFFRYHDGQAGHSLIPAFIELPEKMSCVPGHPISQYGALRVIEACNFSLLPKAQLPLLLPGKTKMVSSYDKVCLWKAAHAQQYLWGFEE